MRHIFCTTFVLLLFIVGLRAAETVALKGIVVDEAGKPVAGAEVWTGIDWTGNFQNAEQWQRTDENGRFALPVPSDQMTPWKSVYAVSPDKERLGKAAPKLQEGVPDIPELSLVLEKARMITGTVSDEDGNPVEGAIVGGCWELPYPHVTKSDKDGNFRFAYPEDGKRTLHQIFAIHKELGMDYIVTEEGSGYRSATPPEKIKDGPFALKLSKWQMFKIRVVDENQTPIPGAEVFSWLPRKDDKGSINLGSFVNRLFECKTDEQGVAEVPSITERMYYFATCPIEGILMPDGKRHLFADAKEFWSDFDKSEAIPTLTMEKLGNVRGTVRRADGTPVAWSRITIKRHDACGHGIVWTNAQGEFKHGWGKAGELFDFGVESELGAAPGVFGFNVGDGIEEKRLDFVLEKGIRLHGTVYNPDGTPSEQYHISLYEKCPSSLLETIQATLMSALNAAKTCPPGGCPEGIIIRQTSGHNKPDSGGKYEYLLPAVSRKYDISVSSYKNPDVSFKLEDYEVKGNENDIKLDFRLKSKDQ